MRRSFARWWLLVLGALTLHVAHAQPWSVQTVALRDLRDANAAVGQLRGLGFDAYTEFSMYQGRQYVRVRVGCTTTREAADALAELLRGRVTAEAAVVPMTAGAPVSGCLNEDVGFLKPPRWKQVGQGQPVFDVTIAGQSARVVYDGTRWAVVQDGAAPPTPAAGGDADRVHFAQDREGDLAVVKVGAGAVSSVLCPGTLLAAIGETAIVERSQEVVACTRLPVPPTLVGGGTP